MGTAFISQIKSTLDVKVKLLADTLGLEYAEVDDSAATAEEHQSANDALVWQLSDVPIDRAGVFYTVRFSVGVKTSDDAGNMNMMKYLGHIAQEFADDTTVYIMDYTTPAAPTVNLGYGVLTAGRAGAQQFDKQANYRMIDLAMRVVEF